MPDPLHHLAESVAEHVAEIRSACSRHLVSSLAIVGSAARADFDPVHSDIDVLVDFVDADINYFRAFMGLRDELASILGRKVDVITRRGIRNPLLLRSLEQDAIELWTCTMSREAFFADRRTQAAHRAQVVTHRARIVTWTSCRRFSHGPRI